MNKRSSVSARAFKLPCNLTLTLQLIIAVIVLFQPNAPISWAQINSKDILDGIKGIYGEMPGLKIAYKRDILSGTMALLNEQTGTDIAHGQIFFRHPHFLKINQELPNHEQVISNGETLWWYVPHKKLVYRYPSHKVGSEIKLLSDIFTGLEKVEDNFEISVIPDKNIEQGFRIKLNPTPPWPDIDHIVIGVGKDYIIKRLEIRNIMGNKTRFFFKDLSEQKNLDKDYFNFIIPDGVELVEE